MKSYKYAPVMALCWLLLCQRRVQASSSSSSSSSSSLLWKGDFPIPPPPLNGVSDPDAILSEVQTQALSDRLRNLDVSLKHGDDSHSQVPIQIVVALVERMVATTTTTNSYGDHDQDEHAQQGLDIDEESMAEHMARSFHDAWGVGQVTERGGTGVLIFVSIYDRVVYISRGGALDPVLTPRRLDTILYHSRSAMRQAKFAEALMDMIHDITHYVELGEPTWKEKVLNLFQIQNLFLLLWLGILVQGITSAHRQRQQQQAYARAASQLSEIDRAQAQALQGQYEATSCPICLENFHSSTVGADHQPLKLLRCGHVFDESCWSEWVSTGQGNVTKCPICKMDIGRALDETIGHNEGILPASAVFHEGTMQDPRENDDNDNDQMFVLRRFQQERNFRLIRLGMRYPNLISQSQIQQWSSPTHNGSLARDPIFQQRDPRQCHQSDGTKSSYSGSSRPMSFGGGTSSGGRAGRF